MYGLPDTSKLPKSKKFPIDALCDHAKISKQEFDADIESLELTYVISPETILSLRDEGDVKSIFIIEAKVKRQNYNRELIAKIAKAIPNAKVIFITKYQNETQVLINHAGTAIRSDWESNLELILQGHTLDKIWENIVTVVGQINVEHGYTLVQQIKLNELKAKLDKEIEQKEKKARAEKQSNRQRVLFDGLKKLKADYQGKIDDLVATF